ncbi:Cupredoxin [Rhizopus microsporus ATCC 52813]|uniref:Cupredoxin n=1 Tax=Rhizopus microsporus ATCC 52813 TaxID=1340429 RepID=A0A2G4SNS4_RHIZD|nr:Cupredoxin [Rhizopus microsporus ATCC 52813]PHZ10392.1 Cupredoxin [Rhizopus microsporus ATCC 52813]
MKRLIIGSLLFTLCHAALRRFELNINYKDINPDCHSRSFRVPTINGHFPGPTLYATQGDEIEILVRNSLPNANTSIHYHGIRQIGSTESDGVPGVTQDAITPGSTFTSKETCPGYTTFDVEPNTVYRLRIIGGNTFRTLALAIKHHNMTLIEVDGELVHPYETSFLEVTPGQRFSVLFRTGDYTPGMVFAIGTSYLWRQRGRGITENGFDLHTYRIAYNETVDLVFQNSKNRDGGCLLHPWHTHGHSHYVIASGPGDYNHTLHKHIRNFKYPLYKDTSVAYPYFSNDGSEGCGWTKVRIKADNPGFWAVHCHITTHMIQGKMIVLEEAPDLISRFSLYNRQ